MIYSRIKKSKEAHKILQEVISFLKKCGKKENEKETEEEKEAGKEENEEESGEKKPEEDSWSGKADTEQGEDITNIDTPDEI